jgi:hypothetical protein
MEHGITRRSVAASAMVLFCACAPSDPTTTERWRQVGVEQFFLHDPPNSFTGLYRSQGIATNGREWFFSWQYGLERADNAFNSLQRNSAFDPVAGLKPGIPAELLAQGLDHMGDIDYKDGTLYIPLDTTNGYTNGHVALFNAEDLSYTGTVYELIGAPSNRRDDVASWVAVDPTSDYGYGKEWQEGDTINVYTLPDWTFSHTLTMDTSLKNIQGAKVWGNWLYMSSDNETRSVYRANLVTGHVEELFRLPRPAGNLEVEGIALRQSNEGVLDMYVEMIVDPNGSGQSWSDTARNVSLYHYERISQD